MRRHFVRPGPVAPAADGGGRRRDVAVAAAAAVVAVAVAGERRGREGGRVAAGLGPVAPHPAGEQVPDGGAGRRL